MSDSIMSDDSTQAPIQSVRADDADFAVDMVVDTDGSADTTEQVQFVPFVCDIPAILACEGDDGDSVEMADESDPSGVGRPKDMQNDSDVIMDMSDETDNEQMSSPLNSNTNYIIIPPPIIAIEGVLDGLFEDAKDIAYLEVSDDDRLSDYECRAELERVLLRVHFLQSLWPDKKKLKKSANSLVSCRLPQYMSKRKGMGLWHKRWIKKISRRGLNRRDKICRRMHQHARPFLEHIPEKYWTCKHMRPARLSQPALSPGYLRAKRPQKRASWLVRRRNPKPSKLSQCIYAETDIEATEQIPSEPSIEISGAYTEGGQLVVEGTDLSAPSTVDVSDFVVGSTVPREDAVIEFVELKGQKEKTQNAKMDEGYPQIPSEDADNNARFWASRIGPEPPLPDYVENGWPGRWEDTEPSVLWSVSPMNSPM